MSEDRETTEQAQARRIAELEARLDKAGSKKSIPATKGKRNWPVIILVSVGIIGAVGYLRDHSDITSNGQSVATAAIQAQPQLPLPPDEAAITQAAAQARNAYEGAPNDMAKGATRPARATALCAALHNPHIDGWIGKIETLSSNSEGNGVLEVRIGPHLTVGTWNNALSDISDHTLIAPTSPVMTAAMTMTVGQTVAFGGTLLRGSTDCLKESSITQRGSMEDPRFLMQFNSIRAVE